MLFLQPQPLNACPNLAMNNLILLRLQPVLLFVILSLFFSKSLIAQNDVSIAEVAEADTLSGWDLSWTAGINGSQATYSNWSKGGINSLSLTSNSLIQLIYQRGSFAYDFRIRTRYGRARLQEQGIRKTDDQLSIRNRFLFDISPEGEADFRLFGNINFDTQFSEGFDYGGGDNDEDILISDFLSPATFSQTMGIVYFPDASFSVESGLGLKQTIVRDTRLSVRYGLDEGQRFKLQGGVTIGINYSVELMENIEYRGFIETFTNLLRPIRRTNLNFYNEFLGEVNDIANVIFRIEVVYDDDFSDRLQMSQALSAGVRINIR